MKKFIPVALGALVVLSSALYTLADIPRPPKPSPTPAAGKPVLHTELTIVPDPKGSEARLQIAPSDLKILREALASVDSNPTTWERLSQSSTRTIIAGAFLFLSISLAGVWLARSDRRRSRIAAAVVFGVALVGAASMIANANAGPPGTYLWRGLPQALTEGKSTNGGLDIEIMPEGYGMKLIVPSRDFKKPDHQEE